jgi:putative transposase
MTQSRVARRRVRLKPRERQYLNELTLSGACLARDLRRARVLLLLDKGWRNGAIPAATGASISTVGRTKRRFLEEGLEIAVHDKPRPGPERRITKGHESKIVAMVCSAPPVGRARWTVRLIVEEAISRGIVDTIGRQRVDDVLREHELKPWRKKNVVRPGSR